MGNNVLQNIVKEIYTAKYFSFSVDSTPDISHVDQLSFTVRYVSDEGKPVERFLKFLPISGHGAADLEKYVADTFQELGINLSNCRGQSYDNAANMSGKYSGLQARIEEINPIPKYSLNLVGVASVKCCLEAVKFFDVLQELYAFAALSTKRWQVIVRGVTVADKQRLLTLKTLSSTRWHCHAESVRALSINYEQYYDTLCNIADDKTENAETRNKAQSLADKLATLEFSFTCELWDRILKNIYRTSLLLQSPDLDLKAACTLFKTLQDFTEKFREEFEDVESCARNKMNEVAQTYQSENRRTRRRRAFPDESTSSDVTIISGSQQMKIEAFLPVVDQVHASLTQRCSPYNGSCEDFSFLLEMAGNSEENVLAGAKKLIDKYKDDFDQECACEFIEFLEFISKTEYENKCTNSCKHFHKEYCPDHCKETCEKSPTEMLVYIKKHSLLSCLFPNVVIALRLFLTLPVTVCEAERSFSKLARIKNCCRSTLQLKKLNALAILSIEHEIARSLPFDDIVDDFARMNARKRHFQR